jgi:hypothetical protein
VLKPKTKSNDLNNNNNNNNNNNHNKHKRNKIKHSACFLLTMATLNTTAIMKVKLELTTEQLNKIVAYGKTDLAAGRIFGDEEYDNNDHDEHKKLDNATVKILNSLIANLKANPIGIPKLDQAINGNDILLMKRFGDIFFYLAETQIYTQHGENGIPSNAYEIGYPLRDALEKLEQHKLRDFHGTKIANGNFTEGPLFEEDEEWPVYDFMFDEDLEIVKCFWYIVKLISLVI